MANMSYCRFQNTANDLFDCINALYEMIDNDWTLSTLSESEREYAKKLYARCNDFIDAYDGLND